jgi:hypothetical protein
MKLVRGKQIVVMFWNMIFLLDKGIEESVG